MFVESVSIIPRQWTYDGSGNGKCCMAAVTCRFNSSVSEGGLEKNVRANKNSFCVVAIEIEGWTPEGPREKTTPLH